VTEINLEHLDVMVDIDDVIFPTIDSIHELARVEGLHDGDVGPEWSGWEAYGCEEQTYWDLWTRFAQAGGYVTTEPIPGTLEALRRLAWAGARIHLVTARGFLAHADEIRAWTPVWVEEFAVPHASLTFARDKVAAMWELFTDPELGMDPYKIFDYAIDDSPKNARALAEAGVKAYLLSHHHNRAELELPRTPSVGAFVDMIFQENS
jgi:hypothetical protein